MLLRERQQIAIFIIAGVLAAGFVFFRYLPLQKRTNALEQKQASYKLAIAKVSATAEQLPALKGQLLKLQSEVGNYEAKVPVQRSLGEFLQGIATLMNDHGLTEQLIEPGSEIEAEKLTCIPVSMRCSGTLNQVYEFYKSLQKLDRFVRMGHIKLVNDRRFNGQVTVQTSVTIYYKRTLEHG